MYHVMFALLLVHFALVYLSPGYIRTPPEQPPVRTRTSLHRERPMSHVIEGENGVRLLRGGSDASTHFDISTFLLKPQNLKYGLGREAFPALIEPRFIPVQQASRWLKPSARVLAVRIDDQVRVYPVDLLIRHEVVNDVVAGVPIFAAYCILADLGAVYQRQHGEHTLTFALSGYTYSQADVWDGRDAFVLWDRETESLWWPPIGKAVSGPLVDQPLHLLDQAYWSQTTWANVVEQYPHALVLDRGQDFERPRTWPRLDQPHT
jgi:hypothetical protein